MSVPPKWDNIPLSPAQATKGTPTPPLRESNPPSVLRPVLVLDHSQSPRLQKFLRSACKNPTQIIAAPCGRFHAVILQEASDHVPRVSDQFIAYTSDTDLAILLNRDTIEPNAAVLAIHEASSSKDTWAMAALVVRGLLRRPSLSGTPTVTFCSVHTHNVVAKKRDASTDLLRRLHAHMTQHNVDLIGKRLQHECILHCR